RELATWMAAHPELSLQERDTAARYRAWLGEEGFALRDGPAEVPTAFVAERGGAPGGVPAAALLAEMDALPGIGHACGHNLSGPASLAAAGALAEALPPERLRVVVVGSPAEEIGVGKRRLVAAGTFDHVDVALMAHASDMRRAHRLFLGNRKLDLVYRGRAAHAAAYPERGVNALDGVVALFVALGLLRQQLPDGVRVHGVIREGGEAPNVIPERSRAEVWVRALDAGVLDDATARVRGCAEGAALATGTRLEVTELESSSPPLWPCLPLVGAYREALTAMGLAETDHAPDRAIGSSDVTHVSRVVPTIHPNFPIGTGLQLHTRAFADAAASGAGLAGLEEAARALAATVAAWALDPALRDAVAAAGPPRP
ncbi:MAG: amidohydrolase, partial [Myxococcota bacterium]|nr:amidohydrolase [Myxococcota bacterium]